MGHGYSLGCRCEACTEKHRATQLKYRQKVQAKRREDVDRAVVELLVSNGLPSHRAERVAAEVKELLS